MCLKSHIPYLFSRIYIVLIFPSIEKKVKKETNLCQAQRIQIFELTEVASFASSIYHLCNIFVRIVIHLCIC